MCQLIESLNIYPFQKQLIQTTGLSQIKLEQKDPVSPNTYQRILTSLELSNTENMNKGGVAQCSQIKTEPSEKKVNKMQTNYASQIEKCEPVEAKKCKTCK